MSYVLVQHQEGGGSGQCQLDNLLRQQVFRTVCGVTRTHDTCPHALVTNA